MLSHHDLDHDGHNNNHPHPFFSLFHIYWFSYNYIAVVDIGIVVVVSFRSFNYLELLIGYIRFIFWFGNGPWHQKRWDETRRLVGWSGYYGKEWHNKDSNIDVTPIPRTKKAFNGQRRNGEYVYISTGILSYWIHIQFCSQNQSLLFSPMNHQYHSKSINIIHHTVCLYRAVPRRGSADKTLTKKNVKARSNTNTNMNHWTTPITASSLGLTAASASRPPPPQSQPPTVSGTFLFFSNRNTIFLLFITLSLSLLFFRFTISLFRFLFSPSFLSPLYHLRHHYHHQLVYHDWFH